MNEGQRLVLVLNGGSTSIKFGLFDRAQSLAEVSRGTIDGIGKGQLTFRVEGHLANEKAPAVVGASYAAAFQTLVSWLEINIAVKNVVAVAHRVVHGGPNYWRTQRMTIEIMTELRRMSGFDPQHLPEEIGLLEKFGKKFPGIPQFVCFDTAFHHGLPRVAQLLPIPRRFEAKGIRRYGFHGLSYTYLMMQLEVLGGKALARGKIVLAHLGGGSSLAAVSNGRSIDTSMSFTPASGVPMGTRSGDLDPGLMSYLCLTENYDANRFNEMVNCESGLLGISETTFDMRELLRLEGVDIRASEAVADYCYQIKKTIGAYAAAMGGIDALVFAGGIGENSSVIRSRICGKLEFLGIEIEESQNALGAGLISAPKARVQVRVIPTDEQKMMATLVCREIALSENDLRGREPVKNRERSTC